MMELGSALRDDEAGRLIESFLGSHGPGTEEEMVRVLTWASEVRLGQALLQQVLEGVLLVDLNEFGRVVFRLAAGAEEGT